MLFGFFFLLGFLLEDSFNQFLKFLLLLGSFLIFLLEFFGSGSSSLRSRLNLLWDIRDQVGLGQFGEALLIGSFKLVVSVETKLLQLAVHGFEDIFADVRGHREEEVSLSAWLTQENPCEVGSSVQDVLVRVRGSELEVECSFRLLDAGQFISNLHVEASGDQVTIFSDTVDVGSRGVEAG